MGKRKGPSAGQPAELVIRSGAPVDAGSEDFDAIDEAEAGKLAAAVEKLRSTEGAVIEVVRVLPKGGYEYCDRYAVADYDALEEKIRTDFGPGRFRVRFKGGDRYLPGGTTITIAAKLGAPLPGNTSSSPAIQTTGLEGVLGLLKEWREQDKSAKSAANESWFKWAQLLAPLLTPKLLELLGPRAGSSPKDMLELIVAARDLNKGQGIEQQMETLTRVLEVAKSIGGDDGGGRGSTMYDLIRDGINKAGDLARDVMAARAGIALPGAPAPAALPAPAPAPLPINGAPPPTPPHNRPPLDSAPAPAPAPQGEAMLTAIIRQTLATLVINAARNKDPGLYADVTFDQMIDHVNLEDVKKRLGAEGWWRECCQLCPAVQPYQGWFAQFRSALLECIEEELKARGVVPMGAAASPSAAGTTPPGGGELESGEEFH